MTDDQFQPVDKEAVMETLGAYRQMFDTFLSIKTGLISVSLSEYRQFTPAAVVAWRHFSAEFDRIQEEHRQRQMKRMQSR